MKYYQVFHSIFLRYAIVQTLLVLVSVTSIYTIAVIGKWIPWLALLMVYLTEVAQCHICQGPICEYKLEIRRTRTMTYTAGNDAFDVALNGNRLQIVENSYR